MEEARIASTDEVAALFGAEPARLDPDSPWPYGAVVFSTSRGGLDVVFEYEYSAQRIVISKDGGEVADLAVDGVSHLETIRELGRESLVLRPLNSKRAIVLRLSPDVYLAVTM